MCRATLLLNKYTRDYSMCVKEKGLQLDQRVEFEIMKVMGEDRGYKSGGYGVWLYCELGEIIVLWLEIVAAGGSKGRKGGGQV